MTLDQLYDGLYEWVDLVVNGVVPPPDPIIIIPSHENVPAPETTDIYIVISYTLPSFGRQGWADSGDVAINDTLTLKTDYEGVVEIKELNGVGNSLKALESSICRSDVMLLLNSKGIAYRGSNDIQAIPRLKGESEQWDRGSMLEVRLGFADGVIYEPSTIEHVEIEGNIDGREVNISG